MSSQRQGESGHRVAGAGQPVHRPRHGCHIRQLERQHPVSDEDKHSIAQTMSQLLKQIHQRRDYASHDLMVNERSAPARDAFLEDLWHFLQHDPCTKSEPGLH